MPPTNTDAGSAAIDTTKTAAAIRMGTPVGTATAASLADPRTLRKMWQEPTTFAHLLCKQRDIV